MISPRVTGPAAKLLHTPGSALNRRVRSIGVVNLFTYRKFVILYLAGHSGNRARIRATDKYAYGVVLGGRPGDDRRITAEELRLCLRAARIALQVSTTGGFHPPGSTPRP